MPNNHPPLPRAPQPTRINFDPYNSSSTGHQRAENRLSGSTSWRDSRSYKLAHQFRDTSGRGGQKHLSDLVGAGSENFGKDGRKENGDWEKGASGLRETGWQDIRGLMGGNKRKSPEGGASPILKRHKSDQDRISREDGEEKNLASLKRHKSDQHDTRGEMAGAFATTTSFGSSSGSDTLPFSSAQPPPTRAEHDGRRTGFSQDDNDADISNTEAPPPQIFRHLTMYLNGSTAPLVSDHRLKQLFSQHGGNTSVMLGRRTTTHVVIGEDCGGGLAGTKIQKEVSTVGGKGIKFVTAQWVLDSVEKGIRLSEARYAPKNLKGRVGGAGQGSVRGFFDPG